MHCHIRMQVIANHGPLPLVWPGGAVLTNGTPPLACTRAGQDTQAAGAERLHPSPQGNSQPARYQRTHPSYPNAAPDTPQVGSKLLKELEGPHKISGLPMSPLYNSMFKLVVLSALSAVRATHRHHTWRFTPSVSHIDIAYADFLTSAQRVLAGSKTTVGNQP